MNKKDNKIVTNFSINSELEEIITYAKELLVICSPYFRLGQRTKMILSKTKNVKNKYLLIRENGNNDFDQNWLKSIGFKIFEIPNLHSKLYISENKILLTSMNLYDYSQANSIEIGIVLKRKEDTNEYKKCLEHIVEIMGSLGIENKSILLHFENSDFLMRTLEKEIRKKCRITKSINYEDDQAYKYICSVLMKKLNFEKKELYQDGSTILRSTDLGQERFEKSLTLIDLDKYKKLV